MAHLVRPGIKRHAEFMCGLELTLGTVSNQPFLNFMTATASAVAAAKSLQSCLTLRDPMDCSLPGFSVHGIFQARELEWGAITFS